MRYKLENFTKIFFFIALFFIFLGDKITVSEPLNKKSFYFNKKNYISSLNNHEINWETIKNTKKNLIDNQPIWEPYNQKEFNLDYNLNLESESVKSKSDKQLTQIEPYFPLNNFLENARLQTSVEWKSSFDGGEAGGTGQQNNSLTIDYGFDEHNLLTFYFAEADDTLYQKINGELGAYSWQNFALSYKKSVFPIKENNIGLSLVSTIEYWRTSSGSKNTKSIYSESEGVLGKNKFENFIGSFSLPVSKKINQNLNIVLVPGVSFLPNNFNSRKSYGNNFYIGGGFEFDLTDDLKIFSSYTLPLGPGNNSFDNDLNFSKASIYSFGIDWEVNEKIGFQSKITNSFGSTPSTGILTIPSDNLNLYSINFKYRPFEIIKNEPKKLKKEDKLIAFGGLTVNNALIPDTSLSQLSLNYDSSGTINTLYSYLLSNNFQLEILNIGSFKGINSTAQNNHLRNTYLNKNNLNYRIGGKLLLFSPQKDDMFWSSIRASAGRNDNTNQGYVFSELLNTFRVNNWIAINFSPKYFFSGIDSFGAIGFSSYININDKLQLIPETNTSLKGKNETNATLALRYSFNSQKSIDLYYSNAVGFQDLTQMIKADKGKFGIKLNYIF